MPGMGEWLIILVIVLIVFGASKLPQLGHGLGAAIKNFKRASQGDDEIEVTKKKELSTGATAKAALDAGEDDDDEFEEVVVRRRKVKKEA
ncbi:MAG TPA: twin-arginine translocase TatA/TatE family subunit [Kofleriaceae bacterium]|nr:twin-arginine translocase TatA/TatE family subunit [Kofleriaceae bacterium]